MSRLVLLVPHAPTGDGRHGGARAIRGISGALAERHELVLVSIGSAGELDPDLASRCMDFIAVDPPGRGPLMERTVRAAALARGRTVWSADPAVRALERRAKEVVRRFRPDIVQAEYGRIGAALLGVDRRPLRVVTLHDPAVHHRRGITPQPGLESVAAGLDAVAAVRQERRLLSLVDAAVVFSEYDRQALAPSTPDPAKLEVIPLATTVPAQALSPVGREPPEIAFIGNFTHPPNAAAALRLGRRIFPRVLARCPGALLYIAGYEPPREVRQMACETVVVTGGLPDVAGLLDRAAVVAAPIDSGGGTRVKVLDALASGKAVVTTTLGAAGISARHGESIIVCDSDEEFAAAIVRLLSDRAARGQLARNARAWAERELSWRRMAQRYDDVYARSAQRRSLSRQC